MKIRLVTILFLALSAGDLSATDEAGGVLRGTVQDQTGGAIPRAKLTLTPKEGGEARVTKADDSGNFSFGGVAQGEYVLTAKAEKFEKSSLHLTVGSTPMKPVKIRLDLTNKEEEVTVTAESAGMGVEPSSNIDAIKIEDNTLGQLPTDGEDIMSLLSRFLAPSSLGTSGPSIVVDGVEADSLDLPAWAIKHIRLNKNPYSVKFRRPGSSRVEVLTRAGHRENYHGGIVAYERNSEFDARNAFAQVKPDLRKTLVETRFMGPMPGRRASFFVSGERLADNEAAVVNAHTPSGPFVLNVPTVQNRTTLLGRYDRYSSKYHTMNARYLYTGQTQSGQGAGGIRLPEQGISTARVDHSLQISDRYISLKNFMNEIHLNFEWARDEAGRTANAPSIHVSGEFVGGPAQTDRTERRTKFSIQDAAQYYHRRHAWTIGGEVHPRFIRSRDASNYGGTYEFSNLDRFEHNLPFLFTINRGRPDVQFTQHEALSYLQDEIKLRSNLDLTLGTRYEWHQGIAGGNVAAHRLAMAFAPHGARTVIRAGAGTFYDEYPRSIIRQSLLFDPNRLRELVLSNPLYPDPFAGGLVGEPPPSVTRAARDLALPRLVQASFAVERKLSTHAELTVEIRALRGTHLYRERDINAPLPQIGLRPDTNFLDIIQVESSARMRSNEATVTARWDAGRRLSGTAQYVLARAIDNTDGVFGLPADSYDLRQEEGRADYDRRHRFNLMSNMQLPWRWRIGSVVTIESGIPYNVTTGRDDNHDTFATDRPPGVTRNTGKGPGLARADFRVTRTFDFWRPFKEFRHGYNNLEFTVDVFNAFNRTNFGNFVGVQKSHFFGRPNSALPGRQVQFSVRYQM